jgi:uncharacterized protein YegP (UPF0339 family)
MKRAKLQTYVDAAGAHRWRIVSANGRTVAQGDAHTSAKDACRAFGGVLRAVLQIAADRESKPALQFDATTRRGRLTARD